MTATATVDLTKMNTQELLAHIAKLETEKAEAERKASENSTYSVKIGRSGTVSVSGFGRYPMSHYAEQWVALARLIPGILAFIKANETDIKARVDSPVAETEANPSKSFKLKLA